MTEILLLFTQHKPWLLFLVGMLAGTVDAIAGGGGLISLPALMLTGIPPHIALGTNKLQTSFGTAMATYHYFKAGLIHIRTVMSGLVFGLIGTLLGASCVSSLNNQILNQLLPVCMLTIFTYSIFTPHLGIVESDPKFDENFFFLIFGLLLGFYDGFFGPGTGSLWMMCLIFFLGYDLLKASAYTKIFNLKSNLIALTYFGLTQQVNYKVGLIMAMGQIIGGKLGAHLAIKKGVKLIKIFFLIIIFCTIVLSIVGVSH